MAQKDDIMEDYDIAVKRVKDIAAKLGSDGYSPVETNRLIRMLKKATNDLDQAHHRMVRYANFD